MFLFDNFCDNSFGWQVQLTDSTGSRRPIMRDLVKRKNTKPPVDKALTADAETSATVSETSATVTTPSAGGNDGSPMQTDQDQPDEKSAPALLAGLTLDQKRTIINDTVCLIHQKLDGDTLQAGMRILLRLTREYELAQLFAELKGPQILLGLDRRSLFESFTSFLTHLIRHIIENNSLLDYSMEKVRIWQANFEQWRRNCPKTILELSEKEMCHGLKSWRFSIFLQIVIWELIDAVV